MITAAGFDLRSALVAAGWLAPSGRLRPLAGGVSSLVAVAHDGAGAWVAKTPRARLDLAEGWDADPVRASREMEALRALDGAVGPLRVPHLRFWDAGPPVVGMELIPPPARSWKDALLSGRVDLGVAEAIGAGMGALHRLPVPPGLAGPEGARLFETFRIEPGYRTAASRRPDLAPALARLVADSAAAPPALVHGDLNPKNVLETGAAPVLLDWELAHHGDPAFDLGMVTAHLLLKSCRATGRVRRRLHDAVRAVWHGYDGPGRPALAARHAGGVIASRLYGKSPVDYLPGRADRERAHAVAAAALDGTLPGAADLVRMAGTGRI